MLIKRRIPLAPTIPTLSRYEGGAAAAPGGTITVANFSRDRLIYDQGAALGLDYAAIPVYISTSLPNQQVEARVVSTDDGGATSGLWVDMGLTSGLGTLAGSLMAVVNSSFYKIEARLKLSPATTSITANRFGVGNNIAMWGQSEMHRMVDPGFSNHAPETLLTIRQQVEGLYVKGRTGRNSKAALKVAGVDALPSGAVISGRNLTLTGTGTLSNWSITDYSIKPQAGSSWTIKQSVITDAGVFPQLYLINAQLDSRLLVQRTDFVGSSSDVGVDAGINEMTNTAAGTYGKVTVERCRITGFSTDFYKCAAGSMRWSYIKYKKNLGQIPALWSGASTYGLGDYAYRDLGSAGAAVYVSKIAGNTNNVLPTNKAGNWSASTTYAAGEGAVFGGRLFLSIAGGNLNHQPPGTAVSDAFWQTHDFWYNVGPHVDAITFVNAYAPNAVEYCLIDGSECVIANGGIGFNNHIRLQNNDGSGLYVGTKIRYNVWLRHPSQGSLPTQMTATYPGPVLYEGNVIQTAVPGVSYFYGVNSTVGAFVTWAGNVAFDGTPLATPANCITGAFTQETNDDVVQHLYNERVPLGIGAAGIRHKFISAAAPWTASFMAMANTLLAERPGEKWMVVHHTLSGTGPQTVCTNDPLRPWIDEQSLHDYATADGAKIGVVGASWYASPIGWGSSYGRAWFEMTAGVKTDGSSLGSPRVILAGTSGAFTATNLWADLYGPYSATKYCLFGPHRFEEAQDMLDATHSVGGALHNGQNNIQLIRVSNQVMLTNPLATMFLPKPIDPISYENGHSNGSGGWTDLAHPNDQRADGLARFARLCAHAIMQSAGLTSYPVPAFDQVTWEATGAYVDVGSSAGPITTVRAARALAALPNTYTHWTDVLGWQVNGVPADRAELVGGKVRIYPNSGSFIFSDSIMFGEGGASGFMKYPQDLLNDGWMNTPVVNLGAHGLEGFPVSALPPTANLANTLPAPAFFTNPLAVPAHFKDLVNWPTAASGADRIHQRLTVHFDGKLTNTGAAHTLFTIEGGIHLLVEVQAAGTLRFYIKDSANLQTLGSTVVGSPGWGSRFQFTLSYDTSVAGACWTNLNGTLVNHTAMLAGANVSSASRKMRVGANISDANKVVGDVYLAEIFTDYVAGGGKPATDALLRANGRMIGPASVANAHPWKVGATLFT